MSDPVQDPSMLPDIIKHIGGAAGGGTIVGALFAWVRGKEAQKAREEFVLLRADVGTLIKQMDEHKKVFEDVVETKAAVRAMHKRLDDVEARLGRLENPPRKR